MNTASRGHLPVMLAEALEALDIRPDGFYVDCTFGRGGHSVAILARLGGEGRLLALDKDPAALASQEAAALLGDPRFSLIHGSFADLVGHVARFGMTGRVAGVLMDLGVSSPQLDESDRGFSFLRDGPLDMRMDTSQGQTAAQWLDEVEEKELARVLKVYGEERFARRIAEAVMAARPIATTRQLAALIEKAVPYQDKHKHPATRSFQAIRIALNQEMRELEEGLAGAMQALATGGRLVVISFHSLEDRAVKLFMRRQARGILPPARLPILIEHRPTLKAIGKARMPAEQELRSNPRARSAVLRVAERVAA
ncbi:MAG: 16S rRNA (cytosine(1402)-N(4))-methyltransferase RsmH [Candidatus Methylumidiphilus sp.]